MVDGSYLAAAPSGTPSKRAVVFLTDAFGLPLINCKIMADEFARRLDCDVWVPQIFTNRQPLAELHQLSRLPQSAKERLSWGDLFSTIFEMLPRLLIMFRNRSSVVDPRVIEYTKKLRADKKYEKIGCVGYCFGGGIAIRVGNSGAFDSLVPTHPGNFTLANVKSIKVPVLFACAEADHGFGEQLRNEVEAAMASRKGDDSVEYKLTTYPGTAHGFAARPNLKIPEVKEAYESALNDTVAWFDKTLVV